LPNPSRYYTKKKITDSFKNSTVSNCIFATFVSSWDTGEEALMKRSYKLLVIDDSKEVVEMLCQFLDKKNYDVVSASNGLDGLKLLEAEQQGFNLVITDLVMPNISGVGVISIIKKKYPNISVIAISGWGKHPEMLASEAHADVVLGKPFELTELDKFITDLLSSKKTETL